MSPWASPPTTSSAASSRTAPNRPASPRPPLRAVLFDLDHTLFDTDRAERAALARVLRSRRLPCSRSTLERYRRINVALWGEYRQGRIDSATLSHERFRRLLSELGAEPRGVKRMGREYLAAFAGRGDLRPGCRSVLRGLRRRYALGVVTNGIDRVQRSRLAVAELTDRFDVIVTSERAGFTKPDPRILGVALAGLGLRPEQALYVGDDPGADGLAAHRAGIPFCWVDGGGRYPRSAGRPRHRIRDLRELNRHLLD